MRAITFRPVAPNDREPVASPNGSANEMLPLPSVMGLQAIHDALKITMWIVIGLSTAAGLFSTGFQAILQLLFCAFAGLVALHALSSLFLLLYSDPVCWK